MRRPGSEQSLRPRSPRPAPGWTRWMCCLSAQHAETRSLGHRGCAGETTTVQSSHGQRIGPDAHAMAVEAGCCRWVDGGGGGVCCCDGGGDAASSLRRAALHAACHPSSSLS